MLCRAKILMMKLLMRALYPGSLMHSMQSMYVSQELNLHDRQLIIIATQQVDASSAAFQFYSDGVLNIPYCSTSLLTHALVVIGYGTTSNGQDYWLVKNR